MPGRGCVPGERVGVCPGVGLGPGGGSAVITLGLLFLSNSVNTVHDLSLCEILCLCLVNSRIVLVKISNFVICRPSLVLD